MPPRPTTPQDESEAVLRTCDAYELRRTSVGADGKVTYEAQGRRYTVRPYSRGKWLVIAELEGPPERVVEVDTIQLLSAAARRQAARRLRNLWDPMCGSLLEDDLREIAADLIARPHLR